MTGEKRVGSTGGNRGESRGESTAPELIRRAAVLPAGVRDSAIRRARESGALTSVARGVYLPTDLARALTPPQAQRLRVAALVPLLAGDPVVSHLSAAVLHGLPFAHSDAPVLHVTRSGAGKSRRGSGVHGHRGTLPPEEVVTVGGLRVTSAARTVVDCARVLSFPHAVAVADAALHRALTSVDELCGVLRRHPRLPGTRVVREVIAAADPRAADAWESHSRVALARSGLPAPVPGLRVTGFGGGSLGRAPFGWPAARVLGAPLPTHRDGPAARVPGGRQGGADREREPEPSLDLAPDDALAADGWLVVRWGWLDLAAPGRLLRRLGWAMGAPAPAHDEADGEAEAELDDRPAEPSGQRM